LESESGVIVVSMGCLAWLGYGESKTYYHTLAELDGLKGSERSQHMRIGGTVAEGSIHRMTGRVDFVLEGEASQLNVSYVGGMIHCGYVRGPKSQALIEETSDQRQKAGLSPTTCRQSVHQSMKRRRAEPATQAVRPASHRTPSRTLQLTTQLNVTAVLVQDLSAQLFPLPQGLSVQALRSLPAAADREHSWGKTGLHGCIWLVRWYWRLCARYMRLLAELRAIITRHPLLIKVRGKRELRSAL
jgi:hypothetical protein